MKKELKTLGLAVDEAILAAAMVGSVGLFAAVSMPWEAILRSANSRMLNELETIEAANASFRQQYHRWPYEMTDGSHANNASVLATRRALKAPYRNMSGYVPVLNDMVYDISGREVELKHAYGAGGRIVQMPSDLKGYQMKVVYEDMPLSKVKEMDQEIDAAADLNGGRLRADVRRGRVFMVYYANPVGQSDVAGR
jgi:hypothetical protein